MSLIPTKQTLEIDAHGYVVRVYSDDRILSERTYRLNDHGHFQSQEDGTVWSDFPHNQYEGFHDLIEQMARVNGAAVSREFSKLLTEP